MGNIKGIRVNIRTSANWWSPTADALYLGLYGKRGGREFRLNGAVAINDPEEAFSLVLGDACCPTQADIQVQYSTNLGDNDPLLNPLDLAGVEYAYLRKETADSTAINDDVMALDEASVLICDSEGGLRRFRKLGKINFSDETGLRHWLGETSPPTCHVTTTLKNIRHRRGAKFAAGKKWHFTFQAGPGGDMKDILYEFYHNAGTTNDWSKSFNLSVSVPFTGCCGHPRTIFVRAWARERDIQNSDEADWTREVPVSCQTQPSTESAELELSVKGWANHESLITFEYEVTSVCLP